MFLIPAGIAAFLNVLWNSISQRFWSLWEYYCKYISLNLKVIMSPPKCEKLHKTCFHRVQFVQFLTAYLGIIIHFVEFLSSSVDRKPQF